MPAMIEMAVWKSRILTVKRLSKYTNLFALVNLFSTSESNLKYLFPRLTRWPQKHYIYNYILSVSREKTYFYYKNSKLMNFFQAGFSRLTDRELETITAVGVCQLKFAEFRIFFLGKTPKKIQMGRNQIACIWLLVSGHWSLVTGRWSLATSRW